MGCKAHASCGGGSRLVSQFRGFFFVYDRLILRHADMLFFENFRVLFMLHNH
jgi:hypothetical protein